MAQLPVTHYHLRPEDNDLKSKLLGLTDVRKVMSFLRFTKRGVSQKILHQLKYKNKPELGNLLGRIYGRTLSETFGPAWDMVVPVPLHALKYKKRGYNQSERFAQGLSESLNIPVVNRLHRTKFTTTQTNKSRWQRWENVEAVFEVSSPAEVAAKDILLVDDVMTTGATLAACANTLLAAGARSVDIAVVAAGRL
ncbi:MAG TPA: ComF family protein [Cyclobacteriaceae bacterium]|nr:ComF family protein [Cyclobacteriaceae bacterium]